MCTKRTLTIGVGLLCVLCLADCGKDDGGAGPGPSHLAVETWSCTIDQGTGSGSWTFNMEPDSSVNVEGEWIYEIDFNGTAEEVRCPFANGGVVISNQSVSFSALGVASLTSDPYQSSPFTLYVDGTTSDGHGEGTYSVVFTAGNWPSQLIGVWTAMRLSGGGVTK